MKFGRFVVGLGGRTREPCPVNRVGVLISFSEGDASESPSKTKKNSCNLSDSRSGGILLFARSLEGGIGSEKKSTRRPAMGTSNSRRTSWETAACYERRESAP